MTENGLYTLEGWRAFLKTLNPNGIFTVSRWYSPGEVNESGRMIGLATAALLDSGVTDPSTHLYVAHAYNIATLVLSKSPFTAEQLQALNNAVRGRRIHGSAGSGPPGGLGVAAKSHSEPRLSDTECRSGWLLPGSLSVPTDKRPFFFNQLRFFDLPTVARLLHNRQSSTGVIAGNLYASGVLLMILVISIIAVIATILVPLRSAARDCPPRLVVAGSLYFSLIGMGFMLSEIALLQYFSVYLGHPIYSLGVCLASLILASGLGSLASDRLPLDARAKLLAWGLIVVAYLLILERCWG